MSYIELDEVDSTNDYVKRNLNKLPNLSVVRCKWSGSEWTRLAK